MALTGPMTPADAAAQLGIDAKRVRAWLRSRFGSAPASGWDIDDATTLTDLRAAFASEYADQEPDPQVVSLNGTVGAEAVTAALMLLAGDDRLAPRRRYAYPPGLLTEVTARRREECPACRAALLPPVPDGQASHEIEPDPPRPRRNVKAWIAAVGRRLRRPR